MLGHRVTDTEVRGRGTASKHDAMFEIQRIILQQFRKINKGIKERESHQQEKTG